MNPTQARSLVSKALEHFQLAGWNAERPIDPDLTWATRSDLRRAVLMDLAQQNLDQGGGKLPDTVFENAVVLYTSINTFPELGEETLDRLQDSRDAKDVLTFLSWIEALDVGGYNYWDVVMQEIRQVHKPVKVELKKNLLQRIFGT